MPNTELQTILKTVFGFDTFRPLQREVMENVLNRRDTLVIMPTGGGKSLCYQAPALLLPGLTVVVSPLIALMKDQVEQMQALGVPALFLNSSLTLEEYRANVELVRAGKVKLLYVAPETLLSERIFDLLAKVQLDLLVIDEAHCISEWGHDFRPEYRQIAAVRERFPRATCLALTATATPRVRADIHNSLRFAEKNEFVASFNRPNLFIEVRPKKNAAAQTLAFLERFPGQSGIIYCFSRRQVDDLAETLAKRGFKVKPYHAGLEDDERKRNQEAFIRDDVQVMVATIAFGMGINKPNVRFVLHYDLPKSVEGYYQEIGRAGRDGLPAHCLLLYSYGDAMKLRYFINQKEGVERQAAEEQLAAIKRYAEVDTCRRGPLLAYFGEQPPQENCGACDNCRGASGEGQAQVEITIPAQKFLSCVKRTGERFGATHVAHVLLGGDDEKIRRFGHDQVSTYGIGKELTRKQWLLVAHQLVRQGLLAKEEEYGTLSLTPRAYEVLRNKEPIFGVLQEEETLRPAAGGAEAEPEYDEDLYELLRRKRKEMADAAGVPPYVIFPDRTLLEMAAYLPQSEAALAKIHGVGTVKLGRYGNDFLAVIRAYCQPKGLDERERQAEQRSPEKSTSGNGAGARAREVGEGYNNGESVAALAARYKVQPGTILDNLYAFIQQGNTLKGGAGLASMSGLSAEGQQAVLSAFAAMGAERLRPVYDYLNGGVSYDELKILRLVYLAK